MNSLRVALVVGSKNVFDVRLDPSHALPVRIAELGDGVIGTGPVVDLFRFESGEWSFFFRDSFEVAILRPTTEASVEVITGAVSLAAISQDIGDGWYRRSLGVGERGRLALSAGTWSVVFMVLGEHAGASLDLTVWDSNE